MAHQPDRHIPGAIHRFPGDLMHGDPVPAGLRKVDAIAVICGSRYRFSIAASILQAQGLTNLVKAGATMTAWNDAKLPVVPGT